MARELRRMGVRLTAEGVEQYKDDLRSASREARLMSQETRLAMAELGDGASNSEKLTTRLKSLGNEYKVQENRVKMLTSSQKEFQTSLNLVGREIQTTSSQFKDSQRETNRLENNYRKMGEALGWNAEETKKAKAEWEASKEETKQLGKSLSELEKEQNQYSKELDKLPGKINDAKISMQEKANEMARLREEYIKNGGALGDYADKIQKVSKQIRTFSEGMTTAGDWMTTRVTAPIVAGVTAAVKAASDWESAFAGVAKTNDDVVDANGNVIYSLSQLEDELRTLAREELPATHAEIAAVGEAAGQLGIQTDKVTSFTKTMIEMGESTNLSAETAASSLARLANITGMSQDDFDRLGSSIVALGNNFATTEAEITEMGLRLAGTGNQVGMTEADIMGLAAAMSSVGIQAEAGGTAMSTVLKRMQNAVADNSEELTGFAKISRMSAKDFAAAFESDPARALQSFVEGLELSSNEGANLNSILGDLGITGVRESDTLLRLAGNSSLLGSALDESATAWKENTALTEEAQVRYETLESQLGLLRNEVYDVAIEFGGPFVQALRDGLQAARPFLDMVSNTAKAFSELEEEQQQSIIKFIGITAAAGPTLSILGRVGKGAANTGDGISWLVRKIGGLRAETELTNPKILETGGSLVDLGGMAMTAGGAKGLGGFTTALTGALPWIAGITLAAGAGYGAWKLWGEGAWESAQRTKRWGTDVGKEADKVLNEFVKTSEGVKEATRSMGEDIHGNGQKALEGYQELLGGVTTTVDDKVQEIEGFFSGLDTTTQKILEGSTKKHVDELNQIKTTAEDIYSKINGIYAQAIEENRELTEQEMETIERYHKRLANLQAEALGATVEEIRQTRNVLRKELAGMTDEQLDSRQGMLQKDLRLLKEAHQEELSLINDKVAAGVFTEQEGQKAIESLRTAYHRNAQTLLDEEINAYQARGIEHEQMIASLIRDYEEYGYTREDIEKRVQESIRATTDQAFALEKYWKDLLTDPVTGEVITNIPEVIQDIHKSEDEWEELNLNIKEANWTTNTLAIMDQYLMASGVWDDLDPEVKELLGNASGFMNEISKSETHLKRWNSLPEEEKLILGNNLDLALNIAQSETMYNRWLGLPEKDKQILANNSDLLRKVMSSEEEYKAWLALPDSEKKLKAQDLITSAVNNAQKKINAMKGTTVTIKQQFENIYTSIYRTQGNPSSAKFVQSGGTMLYERGTSYHPGGYPALVNDQPGNLYHELVVEPDGTSYIPLGRNVFIEDMKAGTKVFSATETARKVPNMSDIIKSLPKFAKGGTIQNPFDGYMGLVGEAGPEIFQIAQGKVTITPISQNQRTQVLNAQGGNEETNRLLNELINRLSTTAEIPRLLEVLITVASDPVVQIGDREFRRLVEGIVRN